MLNISWVLIVIALVVAVAGLIIGTILFFKAFDNLPIIWGDLLILSIVSIAISMVIIELLSRIGGF